MARRPGTLSLSSNLEPRVAAPLDARDIVATKADLTTSGTFPYSYLGMKVVTVDTAKLYILKGTDTTDPDNWIEQSGDVSKEELTQAQYDLLTSAEKNNGTLYFITDKNKIYLNEVEYGGTSSDVYKPAGSVAFTDLPTLSADVLGFVYDITDDFTTTSDFVEGAGFDYPAHTDVGVVNAGTETAPDYKFNVFVGKLNVIQVSTLPTASSSNVGKIYQYIGADDSTNDLKNGYFYKSIEDPDNPGNYIWVNWTVQPASSGALEDDLNVTRDVGGITSGTVLSDGMSFEDIFRAMLNPTDYPLLTDPSVTISATGNKILEVGDTLATVITATFNRGGITPAYGTSGNRAGAALDYALNGGSAQSGNTFNETVTDTNNSFQVTVNYAQGEQPKDSTGADYSSPLAAGSVNSNTITWEFVNALWSNAAAIGTIAKEGLVSKSTKLKIFTFPAATVSNPEVFDVPSSWTVTAIEILNTLSNQYEDCSAEFTKTTTTHDDAAGNVVSYDRYTNNLGYAMDSRKIRIKWA